MLSLLRVLRRERMRLRFYICLEFLLRLGFLAAVFVSIAWLAQLSNAVFKVPAGVLVASRLFYFGVIIFCFWRVARRFVRQWRRITLIRAADAIEKQSRFFVSHPDWKSELKSAAAFLEKSATTEFENAHIARIARYARALSTPVWPRWTLCSRLVFVGFLFAAASTAPQFDLIPVPSQIRSWTPSQFEALLPFEGATWISQKGLVSGVKGSRIRFVPPDFGAALRSYLFLKPNEGPWRAILCTEVCEITLEEGGQFAVGTLIERSSLFPLVVVNDDPPKSALFAEVAGELVPALTLEIMNESSLPLELTASDDVRLTTVELIHKFKDQEEVLQQRQVLKPYFKEKFILSFEGWKGGLHEIYLRPSDDFQSGTSQSLRIFYNDEDTLREKRIQELQGLLDEWVHVLADLIESKIDDQVVAGLSQRLGQIQYPQMEDQSVAAAYVKELQKLSQRIQLWVEAGGEPRALPDLISRTEKQILYGLSLIFQEKAGDLASTQESLSQSQADLSKMLEQLKEGKLDLNSKVMEEAFKKLAEKLKALQEKISSLPQGPQDDMMNREALEQQAQESEDLAKRIEDIRRQAAQGDEAGAMKELESLLNQLSILTKEMERGLDQWKNNLDQGTLQKATEFAKKLDEIKKREETLNQKTQKLSEKMKKLDESQQQVFSQKEAQELKKMQEDLEKQQEEQKKIGEEFQKAIEGFDQAMEGSEWKQLFRSGETIEQESQVRERLTQSEDGLRDQRLEEAKTGQQEAIELLNQMQESQKKKMQQMQQLSQGESATGNLKNEKVEIIGSETKGEKERRRKIMDSLKQKVGDKFQQSHERYFEELLQR